MAATVCEEIEIGQGSLLLFKFTVEFAHVQNVQTGKLESSDFLTSTLMRRRFLFVPSANDITELHCTHKIVTINMKRLLTQSQIKIKIEAPLSSSSTVRLRVACHLTCAIVVVRAINLTRRQIPEYEKKSGLGRSGGWKEDDLSIAIEYAAPVVADRQAIPYDSFRFGKGSFNRGNIQSRIRGARKLYDMQVRVQKLILEVVPKYSAASGRRVETS